MSRKSKRKDQVATSEASCAPEASGTTPESRCRAGPGPVGEPASPPCCWPPSLRPGPGGISSTAAARRKPATRAIAAATAAGPPAGIDAIRNVVLISIDTCRADHLSCYGYKRPTTPNIDAVARDGALFKMALTPVPLTTPAHSSMFTGTYPPTHGVHLNTYDHLADSNVTLAKTLREAGYQTAAFVGAFPLDARFGLNQGFDTYDGRFTEEEKQGFFSRRAGEEVNRPALAWLEDHARQPFFLFLHYYDAHHPYAPHPPCTSPFADDPYAGEIAYIDNCIGRVLDRLRALGVYDNTLVIITGDHGEGLGEHGENDARLFHLSKHAARAAGDPRGPRLRQRPPGRRKREPGRYRAHGARPAGLENPRAGGGRDLRAALEGGAAPDRPQRRLRRVAGCGDFRLQPAARHRGRPAGNTSSRRGRNCTT